MRSCEKKENIKSRFLSWAKKGSTSALTYMAMMWLMIIVVMYFIEGFDVFARTGKTQIYADILSDGGCFVGDNGWGVDEDNARAAIDFLVESNNESFGDQDIDINFDKDEGIRFCRTEKGPDGNMTTDRSQWNMYDGAAEDPNGDYPNNTVQVNTKLDGKKKYNMGQIRKERDASTRITYSGGLKIVREAWKWTWEHMTKQGYGGTQTPYVWGGGHGGEGLACLTNGADCSGFVTAVYRSVSERYASIVGDSCTWGLEECGKCVYDGIYDKEKMMNSMRPGDIILIFRGETADGTSDHVTIYAGVHNGEMYDIECHGSSANTVNNKGDGEELGAHIDTLETGRVNRYKVMRIVDSNGEGEYLESATFKETSDIIRLIKEAFELDGYKSRHIAAVLGNWEIESGIDPIMRENMSGMESECGSYEEAIKNGMTADQFVNTGKGKDICNLPDELLNPKEGRMKWPDEEGGGIRPEGYGLGQWTSEERKQNLYDMAVDMSSYVSDPYVQISYAIYEMNNAKDLGIGGKDGTFSKTTFLSYTDVEEAAKYFLRNFEGIDNGTGDERAAKAVEHLRDDFNYVND